MGTVSEGTESILMDKAWQQELETGPAVKKGREQEVGPGYKSPKASPIDILPPVGCHILQVPQPFQTIAPVRYKAFKCIPMGKHFTFKSHSIGN